MEQDKARHDCLAGKIDTKGAARDSDLAFPGDACDPAVLDQNGGTFNRRPTGSVDEPRTFKQCGLSGLGGATRTQRQGGDSGAENPSRVLCPRVLVVSVVHEQVDAPRLAGMP
jgi:hypothetical protein